MSANNLSGSSQCVRTNKKIEYQIFTTRESVLESGIGHQYMQPVQTEMQMISHGNKSLLYFHSKGGELIFR